MNRLCCPSCRLRFGNAAAAHLTTCPECGRGLITLADHSGLMGYRVFDPLDAPETMPEALAVSVALPIPGWPQE